MQLDQLLEMLRQNWKYIAFVMGVGVLIMIGGIIRKKSIQKHGAQFFEQNPDAARIYFENHVGMTNSAVQVVSVNGEGPILDMEKSKQFVYALPGLATLSLRHTAQRPGIVYKTVTETTDGTVQVQIEARKRYQLGFNGKTGEFSIAELPD
ncbi:MAG: hypothetical protein LBJ12_04145 [Oscillospiraceae bacterium]|jgi:hypothetical protein|nr:hypothetical protein [Oscillospiraceae bacterium]